MTLVLRLACVGWLALGATLGLGCRNERPEECQKLRQCCSSAEAAHDIELVRVQCTRKDDNDAVLCRRRLDEVTSQFPDLADMPQCRVAPQQ